MHPTSFATHSVLFNSKFTNEINSIDETTKVEELKNIYHRNKEMSFLHVTDQGKNVLDKAIEHKNFELIQYICTNGGQELINNVTNEKRTPLIQATLSTNQDQGYFIGKMILKLGANVNCCIPRSSPKFLFGQGYLPKKDGIPDGASPLWVAAEKTNNLKCIFLFLVKGGIATLELSKEGQQKIDNVRTFIYKGSFFLYGVNDPSSTISENNLPREIISMTLEIFSSLHLQ